MTTKKFQRLVLHFGGDKTGSTSIQKSLANARDLLLSKGNIAYPPGLFHAELGSYFCDEPEKFIFNRERGFTDRNTIFERDSHYFSELTKWINNLTLANTLVFSYEGFLDMNESSLIRFAEYCEQLADVVEIVLYVRPPLSYAISAMSQMIKVGRLPFDENEIPISYHRNRIERITKAFGKERVTIKTFAKKSLINADVIADFLHILNVTPSLAECIVKKSSDRANQALSKPAMQIGQAMIITMLQQGMHWNAQEFQDKYGEYLTTIQGDPFSLTAAQAQIILDHAKPHSDYLQEEFGIIFEEDQNRYVTPHDGSEISLEPLLKSIGETIARMLSPQPATDGQGGIEVINNSIVVTPEEQWSLPLFLLNDSTQDWFNLQNMPLNISYHWLDAADNLVLTEGMRTPMPLKKLGAGQRVKVDMIVKAPAQPGHYTLLVIPLQEGHTWFDQIGFTPGKLGVEVVANNP